MNFALVTIRKGSTRVPNKNMRELAGKPLTYWALLRAQLTPSIDEVYLVTDYDHDEEFLNLIKPLDKVKIFQRSKESATTEAPHIIILQEFLNSPTAKHIKDDDALVLVNTVTPITLPDGIENALKIYHEENKGSLNSFYISKDYVMDINQNPLTLNFEKTQRSQDFEGSLVINGAIHIFNVKKVKDQDPKNPREYYDKERSSAYIEPPYCDVDIDTIDDWDVAEVRAKRHYEEIFAPLLAKLNEK